MRIRNAGAPHGRFGISAPHHLNRFVGYRGGVRF